MLISALIMTAIMCLTMIGFGYLFVKHPPSEINSAIGYRTPMSSKNKDTWNFAHRYSGKVWIKSGIITGVLSVIFIIALQNLKNYDQLIFGMFYIQIVVLMLVIPLTEIALRTTFDKRGIRKK